MSFHPESHPERKLAADATQQIRSYVDFIFDTQPDNVDVEEAEGHNADYGNYVKSREVAICRASSDGHMLKITRSRCDYENGRSASSLVLTDLDLDRRSAVLNEFVNCRQLVIHGSRNPAKYFEITRPILVGDNPTHHKEDRRATLDEINFFTRVLSEGWLLDEGELQRVLEINEQSTSKVLDDQIVFVGLLAQAKLRLFDRKNPLITR